MVVPWTMEGSRPMRRSLPLSLAGFAIVIVSVTSAQGLAAVA
jgi:hypothetical protein